MIKDFLLQLECLSVDVDVFCERCSCLYSFLCEENAVSNLTRLTSERDFWIKHIADSVLLLEVINDISEKQYSIADLGCGAGFPALILALALPKSHITAIDSIAKKTTFVQSASELLGLNNIHIVTGRGRELSAKQDWERKFDIITARAVSNAKKIVREVRRMLKPDGLIVLYKTPDAAECEICEVRSSFPNFDWSISRIYDLPENQGRRCFLIGKS